MRNTKNLKLVEIPEIFQLELTNACNLDCIICPHSLMKRKIGFIQFDLVKKIVKRDAVNTKIIGLHLLGESLLHPQVCEIINYFKKNGIESELATNATVLSRGLSERLIKSGLKTIWFSFDGGTKRGYELIRKKSDFSKTVNNIKEFLSLNQKYNNKVYTIIQMVDYQKSKKEKQMFFKLWGKSGSSEIKIKFLDSWAGTLFSDLICYPDGKREPCEEPWERVSILYNGDVVPCCRDWDGKYIYGNLNEKSLLEIWNGHKVIKLRNEMLNNNYISEPCKSCKEWFIPMNRMISKKELF